MEKIINRLREPSTLLAIAQLIAIVGLIVRNPSLLLSFPDIGTAAVAMGLSVWAMFKPDPGSPDAQK